MMSTTKVTALEWKYRAYLLIYYIYIYYDESSDDRVSVKHRVTAVAQSLDINQIDYIYIYIKAIVLIAESSCK